MIEKDEYIKIIDFGEAKIVDNYEEVGNKNRETGFTNNSRRSSAASFFDNMLGKNKN